MKRRDLGAVTDAPSSLVRLATAQARAATRAGDGGRLRDAAELAWLAASSAADRVAPHLHICPPSTANERRGVLRALEAVTDMPRGALTSPFDQARRDLHRACFHNGECSGDRVNGSLANVRLLVDRTDAGLRRVAVLKALMDPNVD